MMGTSSAGWAYLEKLVTLIEGLRTTQVSQIRTAAEIIAEALAHEHDVHAFGSGHSHMLAEEIFYRAGGLARVRPILYGPLMLHEDAVRSTELERNAEIADVLLASHPIRAGDVLIVASNSGGNAVSSRLAERALQNGAQVIAITSLTHANSAEARSTDSTRLHELAHVVLDNGGEVGDAAIAIPGLDRRIGPTSTVVGAAIINAIVAEAVQILVERGDPVDVFVSSNVEGGDEINAKLLREAGLA
jgi:uncharacterized phosphosugar-binding protein